MRVLICGVIGAAAAAAAWLGLEHVLQKDIGWLAVLVGLVTGLSVHKGAGAATGGGYARGGLAALLALAAIVGGRQVYAKVMEAVNDTAAPVAVVSTAEETIDDSGEVTSEGSATTVEEYQPEEPSRMGDGGAQKLPMKKRISEMEMVWMCAAALVAYIVGKGPDPVPVADEEAEGESGEAPPESQEESSE
jgi:hypothetical protein